MLATVDVVDHAAGQFVATLAVLTTRAVEWERVRTWDAWGLLDIAVNALVEQHLRVEAAMRVGEDCGHERT